MRSLFFSPPLPLPLPLLPFLPSDAQPRAPSLRTRSGMAQLSMHSIRETAAVKDVPLYVAFMRAFLGSFGKLDLELTVD